MGIVKKKKSLVFLQLSHILFPTLPSKLAAVRPPRSVALIDDLIWELTWHTLCQPLCLARSCSVLSIPRTVRDFAAKRRLLLPDLSKPRPSVTQHVVTRRRRLILQATRAGYKYCQMQEVPRLTEETWARERQSRCFAAHPHPQGVDEAAELWLMTARSQPPLWVFPLQHVGVLWVQLLISCKDTRVMSTEEFSFL